MIIECIFVNCCNYEFTGNKGFTIIVWNCEINKYKYSTVLGKDKVDVTNYTNKDGMNLMHLMDEVSN